MLRYIDLISLYKVNVLHLHLTDDQGWRMTVPGWPRLTEIGGPSDIDGGPGGFYSQADYARIVGHAAERFIEIVPEIDGPGHASAALVAYPELSATASLLSPFHHGGISEVSLSASADRPTPFLGDVFDALTAEPGGSSTSAATRRSAPPTTTSSSSSQRAAQLVVDGTVAGDVARSSPGHAAPGERRPVLGCRPGRGDRPHPPRAVAQGARLILAPADHVYLDMKYDGDTPLGLEWAGFVPVGSVVYLGAGNVDRRRLRAVDPRRRVRAVVGDDRRPGGRGEYLAFPRLAGIAEIGWSPPAALLWDVPAAPRCPGPPLGRRRGQLLSVTRGPLASVTVS